MPDLQLNLKGKKCLCTNPSLLLTFAWHSHLGSSKLSCFLTLYNKYRGWCTKTMKVSNMKDCQATCKKRYCECSLACQCFGIKCFSFSSLIFYSGFLQRTKPWSCRTSLMSLKLLLAGLWVCDSACHDICWNTFSFTEVISLTDGVLKWERTVPREACLLKRIIVQ